ncbi:BTAD domain-containing putative transcriptional regulator [Nocardioides taihuensis]|uniref:BTAD domain-containing putative transcriptional regulator n=1 Tax=Nocardioides taihuensis TaxID=1835606 RepID=A0ABW0BNV0_9ACTN
MEIRVLGPVGVPGRDELQPRDRTVLAALVARRGSVLTVEEIGSALWGDDPPPSYRKVVQGAVVRLRRTLGPDAMLATETGGYRLTVPEAELDLTCFEVRVRHARETFASGLADRAAREVSEALELWQGSPFPELGDWPPAVAEATRLEGLLESAQDLHLEAMLAAGRAVEVVEEARRLAELTPFREARWVIFARVLYVAGRQADALAALDRLRLTLREELGIDPSPEAAALELAILRHEPGLEVPPAVDPRAGCPWPGLLAYQPDDADVFCGRDEEIAVCLDRLHSAGSLVVAGVSGSGKSSLARAGLVPRLPGARVLTPGSHPLTALEGVDANEGLVIDQAEEAVTLCADPEEAHAFFHRVAAHPGHVVVVTRADHLEALSAYDGFVTLVERGLYVLRPLDEPGLRRAIEDPARQVGLRLEPGLVELLVRDCGGEPSALPLLSHVLVGTWQRVEGNTLTVVGYQASGGVRQAVASTADGVYQGLDPHDRERVRSLFLRLVTSDGGTPVRVSVPRSTVPDHPVIDQLLDERLLALTEQVELQLAHEALAQHWPRLVGWLEEDREEQRLLRHLSVEALEWDRLARAPEALYRGARLDAALQWGSAHPQELTDLEREFLAASRDQADEELRRTRELLAAQHRANSRLRLALGVGVIFLVAALAASVASVRQTGAARAARDQAVRAEQQSEALRIGAIAETARNPTVAFALAAQALSMDDSEAARRHALEVFARFPGLVSVDPAPRSTDGLVLDRSVVFHPTRDRRIEIDVARSRVTSYDARSGRPLARLFVDGLSDEPDQPGFAALSPDGQKLAVAGPVGIEVLDARTLDTTRKIPTPSTPNALAFSPDGRLLAWGISEDGFSDEGTTTVFDLVAGREVMQVKNSDDPVWAHTFDPAGTTVTASGPGGSRTWALQPVRGVIRDNEGEVVSFRLDSTLISPWDESVQPWIAEACRLAGRGLNSEEWRTSIGATPAVSTC